MILQNVTRRLKDSARILQHVNLGKKSTTDKSSYYKSAAILLYSVAEGLVYELARRKSLSVGNIIAKKPDLRQVHTIPRKTLSLPQDICICEKIKKNVHIDDEGVTFGRLNLYLKNKK